jgi:hypothetical protein
LTRFDIGQAEVLPDGFLHGPGKAPHLGPLIGIGRRDMQGQQMTKRVHRQMQLGARLALGPPS